MSAEITTPEVLRQAEELAASMAGLGSAVDQIIAERDSLRAAYDACRAERDALRLLALGLMDSFHRESDIPLHLWRRAKALGCVR